jgi:hypothetical protein
VSDATVCYRRNAMLCRDSVTFRRTAGGLVGAVD